MKRAAVPTIVAVALVAAAARGQLANPSPAPPGGAAAGPAMGPRPTTAVPRDGCVTAECHPGVASHRFTHAPVSAGACDSCHTPESVERHTFGPARAAEALCTLCHAAEAAAGGAVHKPFAERACLACHDPHGSAESALLRAGRYADACLACHADVAGGHDRVHGPASAGACGACHQPHASAAPKLLIADGRDLCLRCHASVGRALERAAVTHAPARGDCLVCHAPHASDASAMLQREPSRLCLSCHPGVAHAVETSSTQHAAVTQGRACVNCHAPHAGERPHLLRLDEKDLCLECHNAPVSLKDGTRLMDMKAVLAGGRSLHGDVPGQGCSACHEIHGGGHRRLLRNEYPTDMYYPFSESAYALCFSCHDRRMVMEERSATVTGFRNGDRNLHYAHVHRDKGRSCRVCHDSHAASRDRHVRDEAPFGPAGWRLPIRFRKLPDGGRCAAGCHAALEYSRDRPVDYPASRTGTWKGDGLSPEPPRPPGEPAAPAPPFPPTPPAGPAPAGPG